MFLLNVRFSIFYNLTPSIMQPARSQDMQHDVLLILLHFFKPAQGKRSTLCDVGCIQSDICFVYFERSLLLLCSTRHAHLFLFIIMQSNKNGLGSKTKLILLDIKIQCKL